MQKKRCIKCGKLKEVFEFTFKKKQTNRRNARCKVCTREAVMNSYYKRPEYYTRKAAERNAKKRQETLEFLYKFLLAHSCVDCGIKDPYVLQFDHVRGKKLKAVSELVRARHSLKTIIKEIQKCDIRCANCHSKKTALERGYYASILKNPP